MVHDFAGLDATVSLELHGARTRHVVKVLEPLVGGDGHADDARDGKVNVVDLVGPARGDVKDLAGVEEEAPGHDGVEVRVLVLEIPGREEHDALDPAKVRHEAMRVPIHVGGYAQVLLGCPHAAALAHPVHLGEEMGELEVVGELGDVVEGHADPVKGAVVGGVEVGTLP